MHPDTRVVNIRVPIPDSTPLSVPLYQTSSFAFDDPDPLADGLHRPDGSFVYSRFANPTVRAFEETIAELEGGVAAIATGSGMGAVSLLLHSLLRAGDHVIAQHTLYGGTHAALRKLADRNDLTVTFVSGHDPEEVRAAITPRTRVLYLETVANPTGHVSDLPALAPIARAAGIVTIVDNTFATPLLCRPIEHGADVVLHSVTKFLGGHSDVTGGVVIFADDARYREVWSEAVEFGATPDPFAVWLTLRGLQTLPLRITRHTENVARVAGFLAGHQAVERVSWTGAADHPSHAIASAFVRGFAAPFCFDLAGGHEAGLRFQKGVRVIKLAPSLGGTQTLILHPASSSHRQLDAAALRAASIGPGTIRIAVGIEHPDDLIADLDQALNAT
ncbi:O-acetylhomoserine aminocarboxypropyltransferase/cysteine synthase [Actinoplanes sichuanensis]|uniref:Trans-sulfuration enzyme family protein n=1 Tax=Actinoplanes sichuanensis TaxID=512349 RepID=A0ABW4ACP5_9ACTN|nr:aminotransferase class I/II-fold pyridoxal phosphate-dependent enzyme [Actinoplanes sichuanensis]BEL06983.1 O-acetylhomoserine aminocarboxypropyltransferase/cysteine synthase [Actinoplanes sichuanensis]